MAGRDFEDDAGLLACFYLLPSFFQFSGDYFVMPVNRISVVKNLAKR